MRDIATKTDNVSTLSAAEFNSDQNELENAVTESGITLDTTTDTNLFMLAEAITRASQGAQAYQDSGSADAYELTAIGTYRQPTAYTDGMTVMFQAGNANTGASTINVSSLGVVDLVDKDGSALSSGDISADEYYFASYDAASGDFKVVLSGSSPSVSSSFPTGTTIHFASTTAPAGFLVSDGSAVSRTTYSALFAVIGTLYGAGDGSTTFNLPDEVTNNRHRRASGGSLSVGDTHGDEIKSHTHSSNAASTVTSGVDNGLNLGTTGTYLTSATINSTGGAENRVHAIVYLPCIKF